MMQRLRRLFGNADAAGTVPGGRPELRVLMVCMGNICRSPTAEAVLRSQLQRAGLDGRVLVDSAGTHGHHRGEAPDPRAMAHAARRGYALQHLRARQVEEADFGRFDRILAMDADNLAWLQRKAPAGHGARLELLLTHASHRVADLAVPDPYYGAPDGFERVLDLVEDACQGLVHRLQADLEPAMPSGSPSAKLD